MKWNLIGIMRIFRKKRESDAHLGVKIQSTVYPENTKKEWYGYKFQRDLLTNVFEKL